MGERRFRDLLETHLIVDGIVGAEQPVHIESDSRCLWPFEGVEGGVVEGVVVTVFHEVGDG